MADETKRVIDQTTDSSLSAGDYVIVDSQSEGTRKFDLGTELTGIKQDLAELAGGGLSDDAKNALLACIAHIGVWDDGNGQDYYDALQEALYPPAPPAELSSITCVYTQSGTVYDTDSLNSLKSDLVVTAHYDDDTTKTILGYTLSGTLTVGTSTITVTYSGKTTTFTVNVTAHIIEGWYYPFNDSILSAGTHDFGFSGVQEYAQGIDGKSYYHHVATEGDATTDPLGLYALQSNDVPTWGSNDFTISGWQKCTEPLRGHLFNAANYNATTNLSWSEITVTLVDSDWTVVKETISKKYLGIRMGMWKGTQQIATSAIGITLVNSSATKGAAIFLAPPNDFDTTDWHHYALTRSGNTLYYFIDGKLIYTVALPSGTEFYSSNYITVGNFMSENSNNTVSPYPYSAYYDDLYVNVGSAKWTSDFDPYSIVY